MSATTHAERHQRRQAIIAELGESTTRHEIRLIAATYGVSELYVRKLAHNAGVRVARQDKQPSTYTIVAALLRGESQSEIAERHGVSRQRIHQIHTAMQVHGVYLAGKE
jgi:DNA-binding IscR family transcriptional regulator